MHSPGYLSWKICRVWLLLIFSLGSTVARRDIGSLRVRFTYRSRTCQRTSGERRLYHLVMWSRLWQKPPIHVAAKGSRAEYLQRIFPKLPPKKCPPVRSKSRNLPSQKLLFQRLNAESRDIKHLFRTSCSEYVLILLI